MRKLKIDFAKNDRLKVLVIGAHSDDIEIGCGGTILRLVEEYPRIEFKWIVLCGNKQRQNEARRSARDFTAGRKMTILTKGYRDTFLPYQGLKVKSFFETLKSFDPDLVLTHYRDDLHQDHRIVSQFTWNTFRRHLILEYEIPKYDGDLGVPNLFIPLSPAHARKKSALLHKHFATQRDRHWFHEDTFLGLMRLRAVESRESEHAEAFYARKIIV